MRDVVPRIGSSHHCLAFLILCLLIFEPRTHRKPWPQAAPREGADGFPRRPGRPTCERFSLAAPALRARAKPNPDRVEPRSASPCCRRASGSASLILPVRASLAGRGALPPRHLTRPGGRCFAVAPPRYLAPPSTSPWARWGSPEGAHPRFAAPHRCLAYAKAQMLRGRKIQQSTWVLHWSTKCYDCPLLCHTKSYIMQNMKPLKFVEFRGSALDDLRAFPEAARREAGYQINQVQHGQEPDDWKPMNTVGRGVREIRVRDVSGAFRVIYLATLADAVYVLHCFQKKTERTSKADVDLAVKRYRDLLRELGK